MTPAPSIAWGQIPLFKDFPEAWLDEVKTIFQTETRTTGETLIAEGEPGDELYILVSGRVRVSKAMLAKGMALPIMDLQNTSKTLATLDQTTYPVFGEMALIDHDTRSATITVLEDAQFLVTSRDRFYGLMERNPRLGNRLLLTIGKRLTATIRRNNTELVKISTALALALSRFVKA
ncbi:MAG: Crp/Fnr family transcriptional regulator [Desulfovibrionaceae bacterium]